MKKLIACLLAANFVVFTAPVVAGQRTPADCPTVDLIKANSVFDRADKVIADLWTLAITNGFTFKDQTWFTVFAVSLPNVNTKEEAITAGTEFYNTNVTLSDAQIIQNYCVYAFHNEAPQYAVGAVTADDLTKFYSAHLVK